MPAKIRFPEGVHSPCEYDNILEVDASLQTIVDFSG